MPTLGQLAQRAKFAEVTRFLTPANSILSDYFGSPAGTQSRYNLATSYHLKEAVEFQDTEARLLYDKALFSRGTLLAPQNMTAVAIAGGKLKLEWINNSQGNARGTDKLMVVVYEPIGHFYEFFLNAGVRSDSDATIVLPAYLTGSEVQCWAFMVASETTLKSTSQYLGAITVL